MRSALGGLVHGSAMVEHCPRCLPAVPVAPLRSWRLESKAVAVYECPTCLHAWFTSYLLAALGAEWGAEPVQIGDAP